MGHVTVYPLPRDHWRREPLKGEETGRRGASEDAGVFDPRLFDGLPRVVTTRPGQDMALGEMAQWLGVCSALVDELSPVPSTYGRQAAHTHL